MGTKRWVWRLLIDLSELDTIYLSGWPREVILWSFFAFWLIPIQSSFFRQAILRPLVATPKTTNSPDYPIDEDRVGLFEFVAEEQLVSGSRPMTSFHGLGNPTWINQVVARGTSTNELFLLEADHRREVDHAWRWKSSNSNWLEPMYKRIWVDDIWSNIVHIWREQPNRISMTSTFTFTYLTFKWLLHTIAYWIE